MAADTQAPNPSPVTSDAIDRAVGNQAAIIQAKLDGMMKAVEVFQADLTRVPTQLDRAVISLRDLIEARLHSIANDLVALYKAVDTRDGAIKEQITHLHDLLTSRIDALSAVTNEKFAGVSSQFQERDTRTDQRAGDTKLAVDAAFAAAKEATSKIETGFTKSTDNIVELMRTTTKSTDNTISDLKDRLTAMENRTAGITAANSDNRASSSDTSSRILSVVAIIVSVAIGMTGLLTHR